MTSIGNFITNLPLSETSGGWSAISARTFEQLQRIGTINFVGPLSPPYPAKAKLLSKIRRSVGLRGDFTLFNESRLLSIRDQYVHRRQSDAKFDFFHGATPWVLCDQAATYATYIDATFAMYLDIFAKRASFRLKDVDRIARHEERWLKDAACVFFGSEWVRQEAISDYGLAEDKCHVALVGGHTTIPTADCFDGGYRFLFIALDFERKGGFLCVDAIQEVRAKNPDVELVIIGQRPPDSVLAKPGVTYAGLLRKSVPSELDEFSRHLSTARGLIHPTSMDTMGMVLIESGYHGCPSIATRRFGIPELVRHEETGYLLDVPVDMQQLISYIDRMCAEGPTYAAMRERTRSLTTRTLTWEAFGDRVLKQLRLITS